MLHFPRWFYRDFKAMLLSHVEQQIQFHDQCLSIWSAFLPKIQDIDVSNFDDPFDNWWLSLPSPPTISPVSVTLPAVDVRHHPSYRSRSNQSHGQDQSPNLPDVTATVPIHISDLTRSLDIGLAAPSQPIIKVESSVSDETASGSDSDLEPQRGAPVQGHSSLFQMVSIDVPLSPATGFPQPAAVPTEIPVFVPSEESFSEIVDAFDAVQDFLEVIRLPSPDATLSPDTTDPQVTFLSDIDLNNSTPSTPQPTDPFSDQSTQVPTDSHPNSLISSQVASSDSTAQEGASETAASPSEPTAVAPGARRPSSRRHARPASLLLNLPMLGSVRKIPGAVPAFRARAIFPHTSQQDFQLSFGAGQIFIIEGKHDGGWWSGVDVLTLERGYIPGSFVEALP
ncbi:MAG: SH3 domain-containing protein [archaeon]|nr:SH3 domain-containing protein [archaeon]